MSCSFKKGKELTICNQNKKIKPMYTNNKSKFQGKSHCIHKNNIQSSSFTIFLIQILNQLPLVYDYPLCRFWGVYSSVLESLSWSRSVVNNTMANISRRFGHGFVLNICIRVKHIGWFLDQRDVPPTIPNRSNSHNPLWGLLGCI